MEFKVTWSIWFTSAETRWKNVHLHGNLSLVVIVVEFANEVFTKIWNVGNCAHKWVQDESVRVRICLPHLNCGVIIVGMIAYTMSRHHLLALLGIIHVSNGSLQGSSIGVHGNDCECGIPVVDCQHILVLAVNSQIASRGTASVNGFPKLF